MNQSTESQFIAKQAMEIDALKAQVADFQQRIECIRLILVCIGGPLNDNVLGYTAKQLGPFFRIQEEL